MSAVGENYCNLQIHIDNFAKQNKLSNPKYEVFKCSKVGDNYLGVVHKVKIKAEVNDEVKTYNLIFKCIPRNEKLNETFGVPNLFLHEICFYEERVPIFVNFLKEHNLSINYIPTFYGCSKTPGDEVVIIEDLSPCGFRLKNSIMLDYPHVLLAIRQLGRFHACSFALRQQKPAIFESLKTIKEPIFNKPGKFEKPYDILLNVAMKAVESEGSHYVEKVLQLKSNVNKLIDDILDCRNSEPYAVINHGDFWTNNMLFKYKEDSLPEEVSFVDFQIHRYASPVLDILYLMFTCCTYEMRQKYYDTLLQEYHKSLSGCLKELGSDVDKLFPFDILLEHLQRFGSWGACMALLALHLFTRQEGETAEPVHDTEFIKTLHKTLKTNKLYAEMMRGTFKDMVDKNYI